MSDKTNDDVDAREEDPGNVNGEVIDEALVNDWVVDVQYVNPADPDGPEGPLGPGEGEAEYDPEAFTIDEVKAYVDAHPDQRDAIWDAELAGKNRTTLVAWLEDSAE